MSSTSSTPAQTSPASQTNSQAAPSCTTAVPGKYGYVPIDACNSYWNYNPQYAPAVAVAIIFAMLTTAHIVLAIMFKKRYAWVLIMGALWETLAFITGALGAHNQQNIGYATAHALLFLLAPLWINAFAYMTFARLAYFFLPEKRVIIKATSMAKYFVTFDILSFLVQAAGGIMASPGASPSTIKSGVNVYMVGIGLQEFFILLFLSLMITFHRRAIQLENSGEGNRERSWRSLLYALYGVLGAITVRIIYRIAEYAGGIKPSNPVPFHEAYSYALDAFPMVVALLILAIFHPGRSLVGPDSHFPRKTREEKKADKEAKKEEKQRKKHQREVENIELKTKKEELKMKKDERKARKKNKSYDVQRVDEGVMELGVVTESRERLYE